MHSIWEETAAQERFAPLARDVNTDVLIIGGGMCGLLCAWMRHQAGVWQELRDFAARHYPNAAERAHWATQDCMSLDGVPCVGPYSSRAEGLYVATGDLHRK